MLLLWALVLLPVQDLDAQAQSVADRAGDLDPAVRAEAATEAARLADKLDPTPSKRASPLIVRVLAGKGDGAALFRLADRNLRGVGCDFIVPAKDNVQDLLRLLDGKDIALRIAACRALGRLEDPELRKSVSSAMGHGMRRTNSLDQLFALVSGLWGGPGNPAHFAIGDGDPERAALAIAAMVNFPGLNVPEAFAPALLRSLEQEKTDRTFRSLLIRGVGRRSPWVLLPLLPIRDRKFRSEIVGVLDLSLRDPLVAPAVAAAWRGAKKLDDGRNPPQPMTAWIEAWIERLCGEGVTPENVPAWMQASFRPLLDKQADAAIRRGAAALGKKTFVKLSPGVHALTAYALLKCDDPAAARCLDALLERDPDNVYAASLAAMAFATALEKGVDKPERVARRARRMAEVLADSQLRSGGWSYVARVYPDQTLGGWGYDLSNTQFAILGLRAAANAGAKIPRATWERALALLEKTQLPDGGWTYQGTEAPSYPRMTAAGACSWLLCKLSLDETLAPAAAADATPVRTAMSGLGAALDSPDGYLLWSLERLCMIAGVEKLGLHDWYAEGATILLRSQGPDGAWSGPYGGAADSCLALLFLRKAYVARPDVPTGSRKRD